MRWREQYGAIVGFKLGNQTSVVISDFDMLTEAFKDDRFCGRPSNLQEVFSAFFTKDKICHEDIEGIWSGEIFPPECDK